MSKATSAPFGPITSDTLPLSGTVSGTVLTLTWVPVVCLGYVLYVNGKRTSSSWDPAKSSWRVTYAKGAVYHVVALMQAAAGSHVG